MTIGILGHCGNANLGDEATIAAVIQNIRTRYPDANIVGPQVLWDDPSKRPPVELLQWQEIEPSVDFVKPVTPRINSLSRVFKRGFDIAFATVAILLTLPLYPFIMLAIWIEDGWPVFFAQRRETMGGREFGCLKFRSMRRDAEKIKQQLMALDNPLVRLELVGDVLDRTGIAP